MRSEMPALIKEQVAVSMLSQLLSMREWAISISSTAQGSHSRTETKRLTIAPIVQLVDLEPSTLEGMALSKWPQQLSRPILHVVAIMAEVVAH